MKENYKYFFPFFFEWFEPTPAGAPGQETCGNYDIWAWKLEATDLLMSHISLLCYKERWCFAVCISYTPRCKMFKCYITSHYFCMKLWVDIIGLWYSKEYRSKLKEADSKLNPWLVKINSSYAGSFESTSDYIVCTCFLCIWWPNGLA